MTETRDVIHLVGPLAVVSPDGSSTTIPQAQQRTVLASLALAGARGVSVDDLVDHVWSGDAPPSAKKTLHGYVARLRRRLGGDAIRTRQERYVLNADRFVVDVDVARALVTGSDEELEAAAHTPLAAALLTVDPLADVPSVALHDAHASALRDLLVDFACRWGEVLARSHPVLVEQTLGRVVTVAPYHERLHATLMTALDAGGRRAEALEVFRVVSQRLDLDLGLRPGPELRGAQEVALGAGPTPPDRSSAPMARQAPAPTTPVDAVQARWRDSAPLVVLVGPPLSGKTWTLDRLRDHEHGRGAPPELHDDVHEPEALHRISRALAPGTRAVVATTRPDLAEGLPVVRIEPSGDDVVADLLRSSVPHVWHHLAGPDQDLLLRVLDGSLGAAHLLRAALRGSTSTSAADVAHLLSEPSTRLALLDAPDDSARAHLARAHARLSDDARLAHRLLSWLEGERWSRTVAVAATDLPPQRCGEVLDELVRAGLASADVDAPRPRYRLSTLARLHGQELSAVTDPAPLRRAAVRRALRSWSATAPVRRTGPDTTLAAPAVRSAPRRADPAVTARRTPEAP